MPMSCPSRGECQYWWNVCIGSIVGQTLEPVDGGEKGNEEDSQRRNEESGDERRTSSRTPASGRRWWSKKDRSNKHRLILLGACLTDLFRSTPRKARRDCLG